MADRTERIEDVKEQHSAKSERFSYTQVSTLERANSERQRLSLTGWPQIPGLPFGLDDQTRTKTWLFNEWFIPPIGSGRTIIDFWGPPKVILVETTTIGGAKTLYIAIETNIRCWNPFVQGSQPVLSITIVDVGKNYVFGTFPGGCGVNTWYVRNVNVGDQIFDAANTVYLTVSAFRFIYC